MASIASVGAYGDTDEKGLNALTIINLPDDFTRSRLGKRGLTVGTVSERHMVSDRLRVGGLKALKQPPALGLGQLPSGNRASHARFRFRSPELLPSSIHAGAWSLVFSRARGRVSTPAAFNCFAAGLLSNKWSMRIPALRSNDCRQ